MEVELEIFLWRSQIEQVLIEDHGHVGSSNFSWALKRIRSFIRFDRVPVCRVSREIEHAVLLEVGKLIRLEGCQEKVIVPPYRVAPFANANSDISAVKSSSVLIPDMDPLDEVSLKIFIVNGVFELWVSGNILNLSLNVECLPLKYINNLKHREYQEESNYADGKQAAQNRRVLQTLSEIESVVVLAN